MQKDDDRLVDRNKKRTPENKQHPYYPAAYLQTRYLLADALFAQELAAVPGELLVRDSRSAAQLRSLQRGEGKLHLGGWSVSSRASCQTPSVCCEVVGQ